MHKSVLAVNQILTINCFTLFVPVQIFTVKRCGKHSGFCCGEIQFPQTIETLSTQFINTQSCNQSLQGSTADHKNCFNHLASLFEKTALNKIFGVALPHLDLLLNDHILSSLVQPLNHQISRNGATHTHTAHLKIFSFSDLKNFPRCSHEA